MPRFFCEDIENDIINLCSEDARHVSKVLRMKIGETITVCDTKGNDYECEITGFDEGEVLLKTVSINKTESEPSAKITLYQAIPKGDKFDLIVQKAVELGVHEIVPVSTARCVSKWEAKSQHKKISRLQKIANSAAKQCGRGIIPNICEQLSFSEAIKQMQSHKKAVIFYEKHGTRLNDIIDCDCADIAIMVGSEGGFEESEIDLAQKNSIAIATLGKLILRCETAGLTAISIIMNITKNI